MEGSSRIYIGHQSFGSEEFLQVEYVVIHLSIKYSHFVTKLNNQGLIPVMVVNCHQTFK